jgi:hypothetical protein
MSVYKRGDGRWQVLVDLDRGPDGKRRRRALGVFQPRKVLRRRSAMHSPHGIAASTSRRKRSRSPSP